MKTPIFLAMLTAAMTPGQSKNDLVGTWKLVSYRATRPNGERVAPYGEHPIGFITYTSDGRMFVILGRSGRPPLSGDRFSASEAERAAAFSASLSYAGRYTFDGAKVVHHVDIATLQNYAGTDQVRFAKLEGNRLTLRATVPMAGEQRTSELVWERLK